MIKYKFRILSSCACSQWVCCRLRDLDTIALSVHSPIQETVLHPWGGISRGATSRLRNQRTVYHFFTKTDRSTVGSQAYRSILTRSNLSSPTWSRDRIQLLHTASGPVTRRLRVIINFFFLLGVITINVKACGTP